MFVDIFAGNVLVIKIEGQLAQNYSLSHLFAVEKSVLGEFRAIFVRPVRFFRLSDNQFDNRFRSNKANCLTRAFSSLLQVIKVFHNLRSNYLTPLVPSLVGSNPLT